MGVQKNIALLKTKNELVTENLQKLILEEKQTRDMVIGALQLIKLMPGYEEALEKLRKQVDNGEQGD